MISIVISGPESTGKSTLTSQLAAYFDTIGVNEYARDYVERLNRPYNFHDVETIAHRQCSTFTQKKSTLDSDKIVFFDTFLIITKVWFQEVYGMCPLWLNNSIKTFKPDLVLLCEPDLAWEIDTVRENESRRDYLFECYRTELEYYEIEYKIVSGFHEDRLKKAVAHVNRKLTLKREKI